MSFLSFVSYSQIRHLYVTPLALMWRFRHSNDPSCIWQRGHLPILSPVTAESACFLGFVEDEAMSSTQQDIQSSVHKKKKKVLIASTLLAPISGSKHLLYKLISDSERAEFIYLFSMRSWVEWIKSNMKPSIGVKGEVSSILKSL